MPRRLHLTAELIDRIAALVPPPRTHRHRYFRCWRPIRRDVVTAMAQAPAQVAAVPADPATTGNAHKAPRSMAMPVQLHPGPPRPEPPHHPNGQRTTSGRC